ncbi:retropepsin-like aspartic protease [Clostridium sp. 001]|uniref:retropepsin-like aspartic protease n=1 Tax=Clostridium sp. 001 TaxID=1970093 RepID=UPI001C2B9A33|nr:retroviral-like aspartic protease family protein [Clostridium sp. 001]QXE20703.1 hypothetical protein B5S50_18615 [Clostridium sp. 001]
MVDLKYKNGLLYTNLFLCHDGKEVLVEDVIVDTGAYHTIISPAFLEEIDTEVAVDDEIVNAYALGGGKCSSLRKRIDRVGIGEMPIDNMRIDFGEIDPQDRVNGLLGLDLLKASKIIIDIAEDKLIVKDDKLNNSSKFI